MCGRWTMFTLAAVVPGCVLVMVTVGKVLASVTRVLADHTVTPYNLFP